MTSEDALIFNIRRFSLDDGPGIRTTVFMKGCPLSCIWCHNPESMRPSAEIAFSQALCILCSECIRVCPENAITIDTPERIDRNRCSMCGACVATCPAGALSLVGKEYPIAALVNELVKDRIFYETSRGGVTFSGGEPTLNIDYVSEAMRRLKEYGIHIALQTSGMFDLSRFMDKVLPNVDLIYYDLKLLDPQKHKKYTGVDNSCILSNFIALIYEVSPKIVPRIPLIPGITMSKDNLSGLAAFLKDAGCVHYELLPYTPGGIAKMQALGLAVSTEVPEAMVSLEKEVEARAYFDAAIQKGVQN